MDDFELYRRARAFRKEIYKLIRLLPVEEKYCLGSQMRRAAVSVTNNIAEGHGRWYYQENIRFCRTSRGSIEELIDDLNVCFDEGYANEGMLAGLKESAYALIAKINSYITYLRKNQQGDELT
ncbi:MAG TPA: four helix bundle protein [Lacipirellula sp.]